MNTSIRTLVLTALSIAICAVVGMSTGVAQQSPESSNSGNTQSGSDDREKDSKPKHWENWRPAILKVMTNFDKTDVVVNGLPYSAYKKRSSGDGMVLPAGGPHIVKVTYKEKTKTYEVHLEPEEVRTLMVDLSGFKGGDTKRSSSRNERENKDDKGQTGRVTVYSKPRGTVLLDGEEKGEKTPGTIEVEPGRHSVSVRFENGKEADNKVVKVRKNSRIKLFFREH